VPSRLPALAAAGVPINTKAMGRNSPAEQALGALETYRDDDADPKERFLYHAAGVGGWGGSLYIDAVVLRDRDSEKWFGKAGPPIHTSA
jgi:hypothetical protein